MNSPETRSSSASGTYKTLRQLGERTERTHAAIRGAHDLVVLQRFARGSEKSAEGSGAAGDPLDVILRTAHAIARNWHPNVARIRHIDVSEQELCIATELIDGVTLFDLLAVAKESNGANGPNAKTPLPAPMLLRIVLDVLGGLQNIHGLRDEANQSLKTFHGAVCPRNIVVGRDGVARLIATFRSHPVKVTKASESLHYAGPEALEELGHADRSSDLYACGVILFEGLQGKDLFHGQSPAEVLHEQREHDIAWESSQGMDLTARLGPIVLKALEFDPALRFRTAAELATAVRRIAGSEIATGSAVAHHVVELAGERIRARRAELEQLGGLRTTSSKPKMQAIDEEVLRQAAPSTKRVLADEPPPPTVRASDVKEQSPKEAKKAAPKLERPIAPAPKGAKTDPISENRLKPALTAKDLKLATPVQPITPLPLPAAPAAPPKSDPSLPRAAPSAPTSASKLPVTSPMIQRGPKVAPAAATPATPAPAKLEPLLVTSPMVVAAKTKEDAPLLVNVAPAGLPETPPAPPPVPAPVAVKADAPDLNERPQPPPGPAASPSPPPVPAPSPHAQARTTATPTTLTVDVITETTSDPRIVMAGAISSPRNDDADESDRDVASKMRKRPVPLLKRGVPIRVAVVLIAATFVLTLLVILVIAGRRSTPDGRSADNTESKAKTTPRTIAQGNATKADVPPNTTTTTAADQDSDASASSAVVGGWGGPASAPSAGAPFDPATVVPDPNGAGAAPSPSSSTAPRAFKKPYEPLGI